MTEKIKSDLINRIHEFRTDDLADIGNAIGVIVGKYICSEIGYEKCDFIEGIKHGISLCDGTHDKCEMEMKNFGFKFCPDENFEIYEKIYENFRLVISRHKTDEIGKYEACAIDLEDCNMEVILARNIDKEWVNQVNNILNNYIF